MSKWQALRQVQPRRKLRATASSSSHSRERERESNAHYRHATRQQADGQLHKGVIGRVEAINGHDILKRVYGTDGEAPTLSTMGGGNTEPKIIASRGREGGQKLEPRKDDLTNTITSVQKDNYVAIKIVDDIYKNRPPRFYDKAAPTIRANHAGDLKVAAIHPSKKQH